MTGAAARAPAALRARIRARERLNGTFIKVPHPQVVEVLGGTALDFVVLDAEHAAFDIPTLDACILAARAWSLPVLVRVPALDSPLTGAVLDMGAQGVFLPHVVTPDDAAHGMAAALYHGGRRGLTGSARSGGYGGAADLAAYARQADAETVIVAQLEDAGALDHIAALAGVERIDGFFIGEADLRLSLANGGAGAPDLAAAVALLADAVSAAGRPLGCYVDRPGQIADRHDRGFHFLTVGSDQTMLRRAAAEIAAGA
ncbi:MAG: hypothetical protein ABS87_02165 [Sphingomonas sp. SCN 67-18]|uniref:HpcH/HpaI aldolase family protein n=1 Tax=uncultured Sphingomonas sp. TaxID=158754 RepID=UPI000869ABA4|nr:aldolase/citrate lyase family protein [Sphingomonas sp. SCN 67-18]ODU22425.1 MAG: hypothetical protein ABS87_02165 [Sphingomonas sp. SCN 67-18]